MEILQQKPNTKRPKIVQAAISLFAERGIDGTSMREIAQAAGVREAAIYRHFPSKETLTREIFLSWCVWHCRQVSQVVTQAGSTKGKLRSIVRQEFTAAQSHPESFLYFCENESKFIHLLPSNVPSVRKILMGLIKEGQSRGELQEGDPGVIADMLSGALCAVALSSVRRKRQGGLDRSVILVAEGCWRMISA